MERKYINFTGKEEQIILQDSIIENPVGSLIFDILDMDFSPLLAETEVKLRSISERDYPKMLIENRLEDENNAPYFIAKEYYKWLCETVKPNSLSLYHLWAEPSFSVLCESYEQQFDEFDFSENVKEAVAMFKAEALKAIANARMNVVREKGNVVIACNILKMYFFDDQMFYEYTDVDDSLFIDLSTQYLLQIQKALKTLMRFQGDILCLIEENDVKIAKYYKVRQNSIRICSYNGSIGYYSSDLTALAFLEYEYLYINKIAVRKCEHCGGYFQPFSSVSVYCGRIADPETGKTCKEIAGLRKHLEKIQADAALKRVTKAINAARMRAERNPNKYSQLELEKYKMRAREALELFKNGEIDEVEFEERLGRIKVFS